MLDSEKKKGADGVTRCIRTVTLAVPNVPNDWSRGGHNVEQSCGMPIVQRISDGVVGCPRCDKEPPVGNVHPRVTSASQTPLTAAELKQCGLTEDPSLNPQPVVRKTEQGTQAVEAPVEVKKDEVSVTVTLADIESNTDIAALLIRRVCESMDKLPVQNFGESKRLIRLQERLEAMLKA